jgi:hypothetical protein
MNEEDVLNALHALAESDRERAAPARVEARLRAAFRKRHKRLIWPYFALAALAAAVVLFMNTRPKVQTMDIAVVTPPVVTVPMARVEAKKPVRRRPAPREVVTDFFPLMEDAQPFERGELLRVSLPASAMRSVGLPVSEDRLADTIQADVLVGEEGLARAIRFVRYVN